MQTNTYDCGVFALAAAAHLMTNDSLADCDFNQDTMPEWRAHIAAMVQEALPGIDFELHMEWAGKNNQSIDSSLI
jgi:Ulp1 family protease